MTGVRTPSGLRDEQTDYELHIRWHDKTPLCQPDIPSSTSALWFRTHQAWRARGVIWVGRLVIRRTGLVYWNTGHRAWILGSSKGLANGLGRICNCFYRLLCLSLCHFHFDSPVPTQRGTLYALNDPTTCDFDQGFTRFCWIISARREWAVYDSELNGSIFAWLGFAVCTFSLPLKRRQGDRRVERGGYQWFTLKPLERSRQGGITGPALEFSARRGLGTSSW